MTIRSKDRFRELDSDREDVRDLLLPYVDDIDLRLGHERSDGSFRLSLNIGVDLDLDLDANSTPRREVIRLLETMLRSLKGGGA